MFAKKRIIIDVNERSAIEIGKLALEFGTTRKHAIELLINEVYRDEALKKALENLINLENGIM